jgi:hypothetical protein
MFIELKYKEETDKAYQLENDSWIPKSILDDRGLKSPYYQIKDWWLNILVENIRLPLDELNTIRKKEVTMNDVENTNKVLIGLQPLVIPFKDIPLVIRDYWNKYWSELSGGIGESYTYQDVLDSRESQLGEWAHGID